MCVRPRERERERERERFSFFFLVRRARARFTPCSRQVLKQLDDQSNDVQSIAVKCLGVLLKKVHEAQVGEISDKLCSLILGVRDSPFGILVGF